MGDDFGASDAVVQLFLADGLSLVGPAFETVEKALAVRGIATGVAVFGDALALEDPVGEFVELLFKFELFALLDQIGLAFAGELL